MSTILGHVVVADGSMQSSGIVKDFKLGIEKKRFQTKVRSF